MKVSDIIHVEYDKTTKIWTATVFGHSAYAGSKKRAVERVVKQMNEQSFYGAQKSTVRWSVDGHSFRLYYNFGWCYDIVRRGNSGGSSVRLGNISRSDALRRMESHCQQQSRLDKQLEGEDAVKRAITREQKKRVK
jgi:hypothetical protein